MRRALTQNPKSQITNLKFNHPLDFYFFLLYNRFQCLYSIAYFFLFLIMEKLNR